MKFSFGRVKWSSVTEKQSGVQLWQSTALFGDGKAEFGYGKVGQSFVKESDSNVLALQRTALVERCDDLLWNSIVLSAKALHRPEPLRHSI